MGNTQVTPISPAIPPLINLAGKLDDGDDQKGSDRKYEYDRSVDENKAMLLSVVPQTASPDLLVSHLCEALAGQSVNLGVSETLGRSSLSVVCLCVAVKVELCGPITLRPVVSLQLLLVQVRGCL